MDLHAEGIPRGFASAAADYANALARGDLDGASHAQRRMLKLEKYLARHCRGIAESSECGDVMAQHIRDYDHQTKILVFEAHKCLYHAMANIGAALRRLDFVTRNDQIERDSVLSGFQAELRKLESLCRQLKS